MRIVSIAPVTEGVVFWYNRGQTDATGCSYTVGFVVTYESIAPA